jgi:hypothetical protein
LFFNISQFLSSSFSSFKLLFNMFNYNHI